MSRDVYYNALGDEVYPDECEAYEENNSSEPAGYTPDFTNWIIERYSTGWRIMTPQGNMLHLPDGDVRIDYPGHHTAKCHMLLRKFCETVKGV